MSAVAVTLTATFPWKTESFIYPTKVMPKNTFLITYVVFLTIWIHCPVQWVHKLLAPFGYFFIDYEWPFWHELCKETQYCPLQFLAQFPATMSSWQGNTRVWQTDRLYSLQRYAYITHGTSKQLAWSNEMRPLASKLVEFGVPSVIAARPFRPVTSLIAGSMKPVPCRVEPPRCLDCRLHVSPPACRLLVAVVAR